MSGINYLELCQSKEHFFLNKQGQKCNMSNKAYHKHICKCLVGVKNSMIKHVANTLIGIIIFA